MECKRDYFNLESGVHYLNGAYMSPLLVESEIAGIEGIRRKRNPHKLSRDDFFIHANRNRSLFCELIGAEDPERVVVIPSASYAIANIANNLPSNGRNKIVLLEEQFPSNYYIWKRVAEERNLQVEVIFRPEGETTWDDLVIQSIDRDTLVVAMSNIHWGDGTVFDIARIGKKAKESGCLFVLDGTQSIGAYPYVHSELNVNALVVSSYKWLLGPYGLGFAYLDENFDGGKPIEESWLNRLYSDDFQYLTNYQSAYRGGARRYEVGEAPDFIKMPMIEASLRRLIEWKPENIQNYCRELVTPLFDELSAAGFRINHMEKLAYHLFGIRLPKEIDMNRVKESLARQRVIVSYRQDAIRISPNVYNTTSDIDALKNTLLESTRNS